ncbi:hypothetical protein N7510_008424 [Penicillium lagena]|uniref:uncharacterized protein n=1 Tax=Penicillium lagena TaxID=94218 RepID=UPI00253F8B95|nr:uncharacterized protein N7510_008424 [Penicillium lagena]KAJ5605643.1 hypothetical protein N7510_008424 [Penicillium lagena]
MAWSKAPRTFSEISRATAGQGSGTVSRIGSKQVPGEANKVPDPTTGQRSKDCEEYPLPPRYSPMVL